MTKEAKSLIKNYEGCRLKAYKCSAGKWTIGYGHTSGVKEGDTCTQEQADKWFEEEYERFKKSVKSYVRVPINENQIGALTSFSYNCGLAALKGSTLLKKLNKKDYNGAANEFLKWNKCNGKELAGLTKRRKSERDLFLKPVGPKVTAAGKTLPYEVKTKCELNIRSAAGTNYPIIRTVKRGTKLTVWAECTSGGMKWGKNGKEWYCLNYCEEI